MDSQYESETFAGINRTSEDVDKELATKNMTFDQYIDYHDIFLKKTMDLCLEPLESVECSKGTAHNSFIGLRDFTVENLPPCYQHREMFDVVMALADLVVMIQVPHEEKNVYLQGTGKVDDVFFNKKENQKCSCFKCTTSQNPSKEWGVIRIVTSASLFKSCKDATNYRCTLFFDEAEDQVVHVRGSNIVKMKSEEDLCKFVCITCDMDLVRKLDSYLNVFIKYWCAAVAKYYPTVKCSDEKLMLAICHPHGCKKYVTLGKWSKLKPHVEYDAAMCPGCSGSYLLLPIFDMKPDDM
ncbi:uncharacterized protein LOC106055276 [Biomphalaria glabrata]|uniref:Uncharacterized protein LOC106055276 n=1 Tax=Biomphalaria glabrata TaxID=6526 RepID=A0A9W2YRR6_BIOGL|nr:uncharacterized protein LOC106055276 [Biomphalaria glabrata]